MVNGWTVRSAKQTYWCVFWDRRAAEVMLCRVDSKMNFFTCRQIWVWCWKTLGTPVKSHCGNCSDNKSVLPPRKAYVEFCNAAAYASLQTAVLADLWVCGDPNVGLPVWQGRQICVFHWDDGRAFCLLCEITSCSLLPFIKSKLRKICGAFFWGDRILELFVQRVFRLTWK